MTGDERAQAAASGAASQPPDHHAELVTALPGPAAQGVTEQGVTEQGVTEQGVTEQGVTEPPAGVGPSTPGSRPAGSFFRELPFLVLVALGLALVIKALLVQAFFIPSGSMEKTLLIRDRVLVNKLVYRFRDVHRGEIVVFDGEGSFTNPETVIPPATGVVQKALRSVSQAIGVGAPGEKDFIKRVIGVGGDRVACCTNGHVTVQAAGAAAPVELIEPYVYSQTAGTEPFCQAGLGEQQCPPGSRGVLVPPGRLWVMGDHRDASQDSRAYMDNDQSGTVASRNVIGRAFVIVWPLKRATVLHVPATFTRTLGRPAVAAGTPYALGLGLTLPLAGLRRRRRRQRHRA